MDYQSILSTWSSQQLDINASSWDFRGKGARFILLVSVAEPHHHWCIYFFDFPTVSGPDFPAFLAKSFNF